MTTLNGIRRASLAVFVLPASALPFIAATGSRTVESQTIAASPTGEGDGLTASLAGNAAAGREVFRFETFGNEGFWTDAMRLPQGVLEAKLTPIQALQAGLLVDIDAVPPAMREALSAELKTDLSPQAAPMLNDVETTVKLIQANAVVGIVTKDSSGDGRIDLAGGDKVGVSCAICHTVTDKSVYESPGAGSIGHIVEGPAALVLNVGKLLATAANSRAAYPNLQVTLGGKTIGRAPVGLNRHSTEAEVDAYLSNPEFYPIGTFDETQDGHGNAVINTPLFRQDLAAPFGSAGEFAQLADISNASYTTNLDPTNLLTAEGRAFLKIKAGAAGEQLADDYAGILAETGVAGYPFVNAAIVGNVGHPASPVGRRVDEQKLADMKAFLESLPAPEGAAVDPEVAARGRNLFETNCTSCHNVDQSRPVDPTLVEMTRIWPGYAPVVLAPRDPPLTPIQDAPGTFDDKMIVVDASDRGDKRGNAIPVLLDLDRRTAVLHDVSVRGLDNLLEPGRGAHAPHPFYIEDPSQRSDLVQFLRGLDTGP